MAVHHLDSLKKRFTFKELVCKPSTTHSFHNAFQLTMKICLSLHQLNAIIENLTHWPVQFSSPEISRVPRGQSRESIELQPGEKVTVNFLTIDSNYFDTHKFKQQMETFHSNEVRLVEDISTQEDEEW